MPNHLASGIQRTPFVLFWFSALDKSQSAVLLKYRPKEATMIEAIGETLGNDGKFKDEFTSLLSCCEPGQTIVQVSC